jgi:hypothetical protein
MDTSNLLSSDLLLVRPWPDLQDFFWLQCFEADLAADPHHHPEKAGQLVKREEELRKSQRR